MRRLGVLLVGLAPVLSVLLVPTTAAAGGWYLVTPPIHGDGDTVDVRVLGPLRDWTQRRAFDAAQECERARDQLMRAAEQSLGSSAHRRPFSPLVAKGIAESSSLCVASDDPRLK